MTSLPGKSSDLLDIGAQCSLPGCLYVDFLPLRCACDRFFCREHIYADEHQCTSVSNRIPVTSTSGAASTEQTLRRCSLAGCEKPSMHAFAKKKADNTELEAQLSVVPVLCARCQQGYCASHRHAEDHSCTGPAPGPIMKNNEAGRAMLDKHFPDRMPSASASTKSTGGIRKRKLPADPKKRAQMLKVELMKTRHKAIPADKNDAGKSVLVDQRLHVSVNIGGSDAPAKYFWFRKGISTGRAIDMLAGQYSLSTISSPVKMAKQGIESDDLVTLDLTCPLVDQIVDGEPLMLLTSTDS